MTGSEAVAADRREGDWRQPAGGKPLAGSSFERQRAKCAVAKIEKGVRDQFIPVKRNVRMYELTRARCTCTNVGIDGSAVHMYNVRSRLELSNDL